MTYCRDIDTLLTFCCRSNAVYTVPLKRNAKCFTGIFIKTENIEMSLNMHFSVMHLEFFSFVTFSHIRTPAILTGAFS